MAGRSGSSANRRSSGPRSSPARSLFISPIRGAETQESFLGKPVLAAETFGPTVVLAPSTRPTPTSQLRPPAVVGAGIAFYGPQITLVRIRPVRTIALVKKPTVVGSSTRAATCAASTWRQRSTAASTTQPDTVVGGDQPGDVVVGSDSPESRISGSDTAVGDVCGTDQQST